MILALTTLLSTLAIIISGVLNSSSLKFPTKCLSRIRKFSTLLNSSWFSPILAPYDEIMIHLLCVPWHATAVGTIHRVQENLHNPWSLLFRWLQTGLLGKQHSAGESGTLWEWPDQVHRSRMPAVLITGCSKKRYLHKEDGKRSSLQGAAIPVQFLSLFIRCASSKLRIWKTLSWWDKGESIRGRMKTSLKNDASLFPCLIQKYLRRNGIVRIGYRLWTYWPSVDCRWK